MAAAKTSVAIVAASWWVLDVNGNIWLTLNVQFRIDVTWWGVDALGVGSGAGFQSKSGLLVPSSNLTCLWKENAWSWLLYCIVPLCLLTIPGMKLKTLLQRPEPSWDWVTPMDGRFTWLANETSIDWILSCNFWIISWCSQSWVCRLLWAVLIWTLYCSTALLMADPISVWWSCCASRSSWCHCCALASAALIAAETSSIR